MFHEKLNEIGKRLSVALLLVGLTGVSCAAKLPKEVTIKRPLAEAKPFNADAVILKNLASQSELSLGQYMRERQLKYLVLTFGSQGCAVCMQKARYLQSNLVNQDYSLLGAAAKNVVELVGVVTDPAEARNDVLSLVDSEGLSHMSLWDPGHTVMMEYFQPESRNFSVPLTVMVSQKEILWRVPSWEPVSGPEIIQKIAATLGVDANPPPVEPDDPQDAVSRPLLAKEQQNRLNDVKISRCSDRTVVSLGERLPVQEKGLRAVLLSQRSCAGDPACEDAKASLERWRLSCESAWGIPCNVQQLVLDAAECGEQDELFAGGGEFFSVFADYFNWNYTPVQSAPGRFKLPDIVGPVTMIFDHSGKLVFAREGVLGDSLDLRMQSDQLTSREIGPAFPMWIEETPKLKSAPRETKNVATNFSSLRAKTKYTLVMFWNTWCGSCLEELEDWHARSDSAYNFCKERPDFCQVRALETGRSESELSPPDYLQGLLNGNDDFDGWLKKGWTMPLAVEDIAPENGGAVMGWYDGWFRARFGTKEPRNVLYDQEGKVVGAWLGLPGEHGPEKALQSLYKSETSQGVR